MANRSACSANGSRDCRDPGAKPFSRQATKSHRRHLSRSPAPADTLSSVAGLAHEELGLGKREIYVYYGQGMAKTKLKIPAARAGTARNINTVAKLADMAARRACSGNPQNS